MSFAGDDARLAAMHGYDPVALALAGLYEPAAWYQRRAREVAFETAFRHVRWEVWHRRAEREWGGYG